MVSPGSYSGGNGLMMIGGVVLLFLIVIIAWCIIAIAHHAWFWLLGDALFTVLVIALARWLTNFWGSQNSH